MILLKLTSGMPDTRRSSSNHLQKHELFQDDMAPDVGQTGFVRAFALPQR